jgi:gamma-glutamyl phosphate reductase
VVCQVALHEAGVSVLGGERAVKQMGLDAAPAAKHEYGSLALTLELVSSMEEAISHIHAFGSGHTEAIITGDSPHLIIFHPAHVPSYCWSLSHLTEWCAVKVQRNNNTKSARMSLVSKTFL